MFHSLLVSLNCLFLIVPSVFSKVFTRALVLCVCFVDRWLSFCPFSFGHCIVCDVQHFAVLLSCVYCFVCLRPVSCVPYVSNDYFVPEECSIPCWCLWTVYSWLSLRFSLRFIIDSLLLLWHYVIFLYPPGFLLRTLVWVRTVTVLCVDVIWSSGLCCGIGWL
jgi:hypothetical protein